MNDVDRIKAKISALTGCILAGDESAREELHVLCMRHMRALAQELAARLIRESKPREIGEGVLCPRSAGHHRERGQDVERAGLSPRMSASGYVRDGLYVWREPCEEVWCGSR